jgi:hypothetical protein
MQMNEEQFLVISYYETFHHHHHLNNQITIHEYGIDVFKNPCISISTIHYIFTCFIDSVGDGFRLRYIFAQTQSIFHLLEYDIELRFLYNGMFFLITGLIWRLC